MKRTTIHHASRRRHGRLRAGRICMVVGRACAADAARPADWRADGARGGRSGIAGPSRGVCAGSSAGGLDRRPEHPDRLSLGRGQRRHHAQARRGAGRRSPDVILAHSSAAVAPLLQESRTIPIVFTLVADPVGAGYVSNLARPGRQCHGLHQLRIFDRREMARTARKRSRRTSSASRCCGNPLLLPARDSSARSRPLRIRSAWSCGRSICAMPVRSSGTSLHLQRDSDGGLIVTGSPAATVHRESDHTRSRFGTGCP